MRKRFANIVVVFVTLALAGAGLGRVVDPVWVEAQARQPALRLDSRMAAAGQGVTLALLGGFRALVADVVWLRMYALWEKQDLPATETMIRLVTTIDPRPVYFWLNGARIVAYDLAAWRILLAGGYERVPENVQERIAREQAVQGVRILEAARAFHPRNADLWIEQANIELNKLRDAAAAAESYRRAWEQPEAPYFTARLRGELLRRMGRKAEALEWLKEIYPALPKHIEGARADVVLERIRELERELGVREADAFRPQENGAR